MLYILFFLILFIIVTGISSVILFFAVCNTDKKKSGPPVDIVSWQRGPNILHAKQEQKKGQDWLLKHPLLTREIYDNGIKLVANMQKSSSDSHHWAILIHGYTGHKEEMYYCIPDFIQHGYHVLIPDIRNHGESDGHIITFGAKEHLDMFAWMDEIQKEDPLASFVLFGVSMGGVIATMAANRDMKQRIKAIVMDSPYTNPYNQIRNAMLFHKVKGSRFLPFVNIVSRISLRMNLRSVNTAQEVKKLHTPILFICGEADSYSPYELQKTIYKACECEHEVFIIPSGNHISGVYANPSEYYRRLFAFLDTYINK